MKFWLDPQYKLSFDYVKLSTKEYAKSFYFSSSLLPEEQRWATYALYGFCRHADNLIDNPRDRTMGWPGELRNLHRSPQRVLHSSQTLREQLG